MTVEDTLSDEVKKRMRKGQKVYSEISIFEGIDRMPSASQRLG